MVVSRRAAMRAFVALVAAVLVFQAGSVAPPSAVAADPSAGSVAGPVPPEPGWSQDPAFVAAKQEGRVVVDASGRATVVATAPVTTLAAPVSKQLGTTVIKKIWEPKGTGAKDDNGLAYTDRNYWNLCGAGGAAVALYYWPESRDLVTGIAADSYTEPNSAFKTYYPAGKPELKGQWYDTTFWWGSDSESNGRGLIMYLSYYLKPTGRTWAYRGIFDWSKLPNQVGYGTPQNRVADALNWEASGRTSLYYFYVWAKASSLTSSGLHDRIVTDIATQGVPVLVAARTSNGTQYLPQWTASGDKINHTVAVVGYDDTAKTYSVMDTCGPGCNSTGLSVGVRTISQAALWTLMQAETDDDGIIW